MTDLPVSKTLDMVCGDEQSGRVCKGGCRVAFGRRFRTGATDSVVLDFV